MKKVMSLLLSSTLTLSLTAYGSSQQTTSDAGTSSTSNGSNNKIEINYRYAWSNA